MPPDFRAVGLWYEDFQPTSDEVVLRLLEGDERPKLALGQDESNNDEARVRAISEVPGN
jgi:hypothetical protein